MKHYLALTALIITTTSLAMNEKILTNQKTLALVKATKYISIINNLPVDDPSLTSTRIDVGHKLRRNDEGAYVPDKHTIQLNPQSSIKFYAQPFNKEPYETFVHIYIHGAKDQWVKEMCVGKGTRIKSGDILEFTKEKNSPFIVLNRYSTRHKDDLSKKRDIITKYEIERTLQKNNP